MLVTMMEGSVCLLAGTREFGDKRLRRGEFGDSGLTQRELNGFTLRGMTQL